MKRNPEELRRRVKLAEDFISSSDPDLVPQEITPILKLMPGGKDGDWLKGLKRGTVFLTRPKALDKGNPLLEEYHIVRHNRRVVLMCSNIDPRNIRYVWVSTKEFSECMELFQVLQEGTDDE